MKQETGSYPTGNIVDPVKNIAAILIAMPIFLTAQMANLAHVLGRNQGLLSSIGVPVPDSAQWAYEGRWIAVTFCIMASALCVYFAKMKNSHISVALTTGVSFALTILSGAMNHALSSPFVSIIEALSR